MNPRNLSGVERLHCILFAVDAEADNSAAAIAQGHREAGGLSQFVDIPSMADQWRNSQIGILGEQQIAAAIAWHRYREAGFRE